MEKHSLVYGWSPSTQIHLIWNWNQGYSFLKATHRKQNYSLSEKTRLQEYEKEKKTEVQIWMKKRIRNSQNFNSDFLCYSNFLKHPILGKEFYTIYIKNSRVWQKTRSIHDRSEPVTSPNLLAYEPFVALWYTKFSDTMT